MTHTTLPTIFNNSTMDLLFCALAVTILAMVIYYIIYKVRFLDPDKYPALLYQLRNATQLPLPDGAIKAPADARFAHKANRRYRRLARKFSAKGKLTTKDKLHKIRCEVFFRFALEAHNCAHNDIRQAYMAFCATHDVDELLADKDAPFMSSNMPTPTDSTIAQISQALTHLSDVNFDRQLHSAASMSVMEYRRFLIFWHRLRKSSEKVEAKTNALNRVKKQVKEHVQNHNTLAGILNNELDRLRIISNRNLFFGRELLRNAVTDTTCPTAALTIQSVPNLPAVAVNNYLVAPVSTPKEHYDYSTTETHHFSIINSVNTMLSGCQFCKSDLLRGLELARAIHKTNWGFRHIYMPLHQKVYKQRQPLSASEISTLNNLMADIARLTLAQQ